MKKTLIRMLLMAFLLTACSGINTKKPSNDIVLLSLVEKDDCSICGDDSTHEIRDYIGQDNIGFLNLNTLDFYRIEINRYDYNGELIEKATGAVTLGKFDSGESEASIMCDPDRGYASIQISSSSNGVDAETLREHLCQDCLDILDYHTHSLNDTQEIAVINLMTGELRALENSCPWFTFDNFLISIEFKESGVMELEITYRPLRYQNTEA